MIKSLIKRYHWYAVYKDGPARVKAARWFLKKMQQGTTYEEVSFYWGTGSDLIYYLSKNVKDGESKAALNSIAVEMVAKCNSVGMYPGSDIPFDLDQGDNS